MMVVTTHTYLYGQQNPTLTHEMQLPQHRDHLWKRRRRRLEKKEPGFIRFIKKIGRGIKKGFQKLGEFVLNLFS